MSKTLREDVAEWLANPRRVEELTAYIEAALREAVREERAALRDLLKKHAPKLRGIRAALDARDAEPEEGA